MCWVYMTAHRDPPVTETESLPIIEERLLIGRCVVPTGKVRVRTVTERIETVIEATVGTSEVEVVHVPLGHEVETMPEVRIEGDTMIVPVVEEVPFVTWRLVLREEIHIKRRRTEMIRSLPVQLLKQRPVVSREGRRFGRAKEQDDS